MTLNALKLVLVSTPIGYLGSGKGGGVELTLQSLIQGLVSLGNEITLVAPSGSHLFSKNLDIDIKLVSGNDQPSWQHQPPFSPVVIPHDGVLPKLWEEALTLSKEADAVLNFGYDWLPIWLTPHLNIKIFHLISMSAESEVMKSLISDLSRVYNSRLAFHTHSQAKDYELFSQPIILGNGFCLDNYDFQPLADGGLGWAGRVAPEKGLEDAVSVAVSLGEKLLVWGVLEDHEYAKNIENSFPPGSIDWRGFLPTDKLQKEMGKCRALINTPKWNEAYGNVVVEALACGVPVVSYERGGPSELINSGLTGFLVPPNDLDLLIESTKLINKIDRKECRNWVEKTATQDIFAGKVQNWIRNGLNMENIQTR